MSLFDLRLVDPRDPDGYSEYVNGWDDLRFSTDRKAPGSLDFSIARDADHRELMETYQLVALIQDGAEGEDCRYIVRGIDGNDLPTDNDPVPKVSYSFKSVWDAFRDVEVSNTGTNEQIVYSKQTVGQILLSILTVPANLGLFDWWGYNGLTFTATKDTQGQPWPVIDSVQFDDGVKIFEVMDWLIQNHYAEISTLRGRVNAYAPDTRGLDLTKAQRPLVLREGYHIDDAPWQRSYDDVATAVTVVGGDTPPASGDGDNGPRLKVKVYAVGAPVLQTDFAIPVGYGNVYGGYSLHDKNRKVDGKDWAQRAPEIARQIIESGVWVWGALELHEETADDMPNGGTGLLLDELHKRDLDWDLMEGSGGNHLLYRPSRVGPGETPVQLAMPGGRQATEFVVLEPISGFMHNVLLAHLRANDLAVRDKNGKVTKAAKSRAKERKQQAQFLVKRIKGWKRPGFLMADINDRTHRQGNAREIIEASGMLSLRDREPNLPNAKKNSLKPGSDGVWIEDIWTSPSQKTSQSAGILTTSGTSGFHTSDHDLYLRTTLTFRAGIPQEVSRFGIRERRITVEGVQSLDTLRDIGKRWIALRSEPRTSRTFKTTVVESPRPPAFRQPGAAGRPPAVFKQASVRQLTATGDVGTIAYTDGFVFASQLVGSSTLITRIRGGFAAGTMTVPTAAADEMQVERVLKDPNQKNVDTNYVLIPIGSTGLASTATRTWVRIPWIAAKVWKANELVPYIMRTPPARDALARPANIQGETGPMQGYYWRLIGSPSSTTATSGVARIDTVRRGQVVGTLDVTQLGRTAGAPDLGRVTPAGLATTMVDGWPHLAIGIQSGAAGPSMRLGVWTYPILIDELGQAYVDRKREQFVPSIDYRVGDRILIDLANGQVASGERVEVISGSCDDDTSGTYIITVGDWLADRDVAVDRLLAKYDGD